jgi:capsular exopolysaccharide synthesis family protein
MIGLLGGVGLCFLVEYMDNTVKSPEDVEKMVGLPSLGVIPFLSPDGMSKKRFYGRYGKADYAASSSLGDSGAGALLPEVKKIEFVNLKHPKFFISEDYRTIRTSILLSRAEKPPKTIVFTSSLPSEGKTATVVNMAVAFGQLGKRILVIDADLRKPRLQSLFKVRSTDGLSGFLTGKLSIENAIHQTNIDNIFFMPSGILPPNPAELLESPRMHLLMEGVKRGFDITLLDTPPVLAVTDAVVVGNQVDGVIMIVQHEKTARKPFLKAVEELRQNNVKIIGVMFNQAKVSKKNYYYMDYYIQNKDDLLT